MSHHARWRRKCKTAPHQPARMVPGQVLSSTCSLAHGVGARNNGRSSVLLDLCRTGRCGGPGGIVLSVAAAQFTRGCQPQAGPGYQWSDADRPGRAPSQRSSESGAGGVSVGRTARTARLAAARTARTAAARTARTARTATTVLEIPRIWPTAKSDPQLVHAALPGPPIPPD
jgi:hypothetical protein